MDNFLTNKKNNLVVRERAEIITDVRLTNTGEGNRNKKKLIFRIGKKTA